MPKIKSVNGIANKLKLGSAIGIGMNSLFAISDYKDAREQGSSRIGSVARSAGSFALYEALGWWTLPFQLAPEIPKAAVNGYEALGRLTRQMNQQSKQVPFVNSSFNDYNQAFTMRQAGMKMAEASRYKLQQTLMGNEAAYLK